MKSKDGQTGDHPLEGDGRLFLHRQGVSGIFAKLILVLTLATVILFVISCRDATTTIQSTFPLDNELRSFLVRSDRAIWNTKEELGVWHTALEKNHIPIKSNRLHRVVMEEEYFVPKSLSVPKEVVVFRFEEGVLFVRIQMESE